MQFVPHRFRFGVVLKLARLATPLLRGTEAYQTQMKKGFHEPCEITLHLLLNALTKTDCTFDPTIAIDGYEALERAYPKRKGVLLIGHHAALTMLMVRVLYDQNIDQVVVTPDRQLRVPGTGVLAKTIQGSPTFLVQIRNRLRDGKVVCAMPDRAEHQGARTVEFNTAHGSVIFAPAMLQVAARAGAEILFTEVRLKDNRLRAVIVEPRTPMGACVEEITEDFISFVRERVGPGV